jgi:hypothetical protein
VLACLELTPKPLAHRLRDITGTPRILAMHLPRIVSASRASRIES